MATIVRLPKLGLSDRGEIVEWTISPGDKVQEGDVIAVLESDKSAVDIEASAEGVLLTTYVDAGDEISIEPGRPIAAIGNEEETPPSLEDGNEGEPSSEESVDVAANSGEMPPAIKNDLRVTPKARVLAYEQNVDLDVIPGTGPDDSVTVGDVRSFLDEDGAETPGETEVIGSDRPPKATPKAKRWAREQDVDLHGITGTGPKGAITQQDVERSTSSAHLESPAPTTSSTPAPSGEYTITEVRDQTRVEQMAAERLTQSAREKPHVRGNRTVSIERLEAIADDLSTTDGLSPSVNDLLFYAVVKTLQEHPKFNAIYKDGEHCLVEEINVGYAVDSEKGLMVPVVKKSGGKSLEEVSKTRHNVVDRIMEGRYEPADLRSGTFTVTNVGALGMDSSFSLINPPQVSILAIGRRKPALFDDGDEYVTKKSVTLSLLIDHRVLDGGDAGAFLTTLTEYIERPAQLLQS